MAQALDEHRGGFRADFCDHLGARLSIVGIDPKLDQFVTVERLDDFVHDRRGEAVVADDDHGLEVVGQRLELTFLRMGKGKHGRRPQHG